MAKRTASPRKPDKRAAESGRGWSVTQSNRLRRVISMIQGLTASADYHMDRMTLGKLREFCRMHDRRSALFSGILDRAIDNIFGAEFDFIPRTDNPELDKQVKAYIKKRMEPHYADASGEMHFVELCHTALRSVWNDGDVLSVKQSDGTLMAFEADQMETPSDFSGDNIVLGAEKDRRGRIVAVHISQRPQGKDGMPRGGSSSFARVQRENLIWPAFRKRFGQTRGIPVIAAALSTYGRLDNYLEFESLAAEGNAMQGLKIKKDLNADWDNPAGTEDNADPETSGTFKKLQKMEPFQVWELLPGEDIEMVANTRPAASFSPYTLMMCRIVGTAIGYPLELILLDSSMGNFSNYRGAMMIAQKNFRRWQMFFERKFCGPWYVWQISRGIASGEIPADAMAYRFDIQWPGWPYIKPLEDAQANEINIRLLTKSVSQCIREAGGEPAEVIAEIIAERKQFDAAGLKLILKDDKSGSASSRGEETDAKTSEEKDG